MNIDNNAPIGHLFLWGLDVKTKHLVNIKSLQDLKALVQSDEYANTPHRYVLGGGANTLFTTSYFDGMVMVIDTKGIELQKEDEKYSYWKIMAGEDWISLVEHMVCQNNLGGLENLAYIPGKVGSAPIQNIAAYGQSFENVCESVEVLELDTLSFSNIQCAECAFNYRSSIFKQRHMVKDRNFVIWSVTLKFAKPEFHQVETDYFSNYESLRSELAVKGVVKPTIQDIYNGVVSLRKKKLPDWTRVGTNGSLFMNPVVPGNKLRDLLIQFPRLQYYPTEKMQYVDASKLDIHDEKLYKIAAGHVFDELGWKGKRVGQVGTWKNHALVLCNYGTKNPTDILRVIRLMQDDFESATGIRLEPEINMIPS